MKSILVLLLFSSSLLVGQTTGRISGVVTDPTGAAIPGASVSLLIAGGKTAILTGATSEEGLFFFPGLQPVKYDLTIEAKGFRKEIQRGIKVNAGLEMSLPAIKLELSTQAEIVEVVAQTVGVQTSNAEIASTITNEQIRRLPTLNRSPLALISTQAGVGGNGRTNTTINGLRPSFTNITIDGINIQDNFIRTNTLDFLPNMLLIDQIGEFTVATSNTNAADGNGAAQIKFVTPSGTNEYHGSLYWYNRNNIASANTWFSNRNGVRRPFLNQNQTGGSFGGRIIRDKLFFYSNYEAIRLRQQSAATRTILRQPARDGIFTYRDTAGNIRTANVLQAAGVAADARIRQILGSVPGAERINRDDIGDTLNTGGYSFNIRNNRTRDNVTGKADYVHSPKHVFSGTVLWNRDIIDRPDLANDYSTVPKVFNDNKIKLFSGTWRWNPMAAFTNEFRGGLNSAPAVFFTNENFGEAIVNLPLVANPVNTFRGQGRFTDTYNIQNNASWFKSKHTFVFGLQYQNIHADPFNDAGNIPVYTMAMSPANTAALDAQRLPGIRSQDIGIANSLLALHGGFLSSATQTFNVTSRTSGFVPGATSARRLRQQNWALYFQDTWRVSRRLTLNLGTRFEYFTPVDEADALVLLPVVQGNVIDSLLNPNGTLDFAGGAVGRRWYGRDFNNFSPNVGLAWQPLDDGGKTVIRAGYSINYPNDEFIRSVDNNVLTNSGLQQTATLNNLTSTVNSGLPRIGSPTFKVPRTYRDNYLLNPSTAFGIPDPNLRTPYVQQWSFGFQREISRGVIEVRYVGNRSTKQFRAFDYNQVLVKESEMPGYFTDFRNAYNNGFLALARTGVFDPRFNSTVPGSRPLPFFDRLPSAGLLTNATIRNLIQTGEAGELGAVYQVNSLNGPFNFFRNQYSLGTNMMTNYSNANYNAVQVDYRRTFATGYQIQANYTYSKVLSDAAGDAQTRFEPFLDLANAPIERARTPFDLTHSFKVNGVWDLPVGRGKRVEISNAVLNHIAGGWSLSGFMTWRSGAPFSILSGRGTLNRGARSGSNTATSSIDKARLDQLLQFRQTGIGPYFLNASAIGADGRGVASDGAAPFNGQAFFHPGPGDLGALQRRMFSGPAFWNTDMALLKTFQIQENHRLEFRSEWFNFSNTPSFFIGDQSVNSVQFGRITSTASGRRIVQFGLYYRF
jgi:hypothetical protein